VLGLAVQQGDEIAVVVLPRHVGEQGVGLQYGGQALRGFAAAVADLDQLRQMGSDLALVPRGQDRLDIREVLVQRGPPDPGLRGDPRHRDREQPVSGHQCRGGVEDRVAHLATVGLDRLVPQLRHHRTIRDDR
jgi:hypothetical protein